MVIMNIILKIKICGFAGVFIKHNGKPAILYPYFDENDNLNSGITLQNPKKQISRLYNELKKL